MSLKQLHPDRLLKLSRIIDRVAEVFEVSRDDLMSHRRPDPIVRARHVAMQLFWEEGLGACQIGWFFDRTHHTVALALVSLDGRLWTEYHTKTLLEQLRQEFKGCRTPTKEREAA